MVYGISQGNGEPTIMPNMTPTFNIHATRDFVQDNKTVTRKMRLLRGGQIRNQRMFATISTPFTPGNVNMPYTGNMTITIAGGTIDFDTSAGTPDTVVISNPFIITTTPVVINNVNANGGTCTVAGLTATVASGQVTIAGANASATTILASGTISISVGRRTDPRQ